MNYFPQTNYLYKIELLVLDSSTWKTFSCEQTINGNIWNHLTVVKHMSFRSLKKMMLLFTLKAHIFKTGFSIK